MPNYLNYLQTASDLKQRDISNQMAERQQTFEENQAGVRNSLAQKKFDQEQADQDKQFLSNGARTLATLSSNPAVFNQAADFYANHPISKRLGITRESITPDTVSQLVAQMDMQARREPEKETFSSPQDVVFKGKPSVVQVGSKGTVRPVEGAAPYNKPTASSNTGPLDTDTLELVAQDYLKTGKLPPLYRDNETKIIIMKRAAQIAKDSGNDAAAAVIERQNFAANKASLSKVTAQKNMVGSFEKTFLKNLDLAMQLSARVDRTGSPLINKAVIAWKQGVSGDAETKGFINALTTARTEYAKILSGATGAAGVTDAGRKEAEELFSKIDSPETLAYVTEVAKQEAHNRMASFDEQLGEITGGMGNKKPQQAPQAEITATGPNGQKIVLRNGQWVPM